jgi:hypothetical protein
LSLHQTFVSCFYQLRGGRSWNAKKIVKSIQTNLFWADLSHSEPPCRAVQRGVKRERGECASEQLKSRFMIHRPSIDKSSSQKFGEGSKSSWERDPCVVNNQRATISSHFVEHSIAANVFFLSSTYIPHVQSMFDWTNWTNPRTILEFIWMEVCLERRH